MLVIRQVGFVVLASGLIVRCFSLTQRVLGPLLALFWVCDVFLRLIEPRQRLPQRLLRLFEVGSVLRHPRDLTKLLSQNLNLLLQVQHLFPRILHLVCCFDQRNHHLRFGGVHLGGNTISGRLLLLHVAARKLFGHRDRLELCCGGSLLFRGTAFQLLFRGGNSDVGFDQHCVGFAQRLFRLLQLALLDCEFGRFFRKVDPGVFGCQLVQRGGRRFKQCLCYRQVCFNPDNLLLDTDHP